MRHNNLVLKTARRLGYPFRMAVLHYLPCSICLVDWRECIPLPDKPEKATVNEKATVAHSIPSVMGGRGRCSDSTKHMSYRSKGWVAERKPTRRNNSWSYWEKRHALPSSGFSHFALALPPQQRDHSSHKQISYRYMKNRDSLSNRNTFHLS